MKDLIARMKNNLHENTAVEADDIEELISYFTEDTIRRLESMHEMTGLEYSDLIECAVKAIDNLYSDSHE